MSLRTRQTKKSLIEMNFRGVLNSLQASLKKRGRSFAAAVSEKPSICRRLYVKYRGYQGNYEKA